MFLLDTNVLIYASKNRSQKLTQRFDSLGAGDAAMSVVTYFELFYGAMKSQRRERNLFELDLTRALIPVLPLTEDCASHYGRIRADLERKGTLIGGHDMLIAAHALSLSAILVTNNVREFARVPGLRLENWAD